MKRLLKSWVFWVFVALPPLVGAVLLSVRVEIAYDCRTCLSRRIRTQWFLMLTETVFFPLLPPAEKISESHHYRNLVTGSYEHQWTSLVVKGTSLGGGERTPKVVAINALLLPGIVMARPALLMDYERNPLFREFIQGKIRRGDAGAEECRAVLMLSDYMAPAARTPEVAARREAWLGEFEVSPLIAKIPPRRGSEGV